MNYIYKILVSKYKKYIRHWKVLKHHKHQIFFSYRQGGLSLSPTSLLSIVRFCFVPSSTLFLAPININKQINGLFQ